MDNKSWLNKETNKVLESFKEELMRRLEPVVLTLVGRLRQMEKDKPGSGLMEIEYMLQAGDINKPMYDILLPALENPDKEFEFKLAKAKKKKNEPTKLG